MFHVKRIKKALIVEKWQIIYVVLKKHIKLTINIKKTLLSKNKKLTNVSRETLVRIRL